MTQASYQDEPAGGRAAASPASTGDAPPTVRDDADAPNADAAGTPVAPRRGRSFRQRVRHFWHTVNGLITIPDVLAKLGFWLYRGTMRRTLGIAIALLTVVLVGKHDANEVDLTFQQAFTFTGAFLLISFLGGLTLMGISGSFARSQLTSSEAKGSNLLEDMKKARSTEHRDRFWERVFRYEAALASPADLAAEEGLINRYKSALRDLCHPNTARDWSPERLHELRVVMGSLGRTREGWDLLFDYLCQAPIPRTVLKGRLRYDLSKIKDWYDGAPFHHTDTKLQEQFSAAERLQEAKREVSLDWWFLFWHTRKRLLQSMWFRMITRALQLRVARACQYLDNAYPPFHFAPDQFLWPSDETYRIVRQDAGDEALAELIDLRKRIFRRVLSPEPELSHALMQRAIYPNFEVASHLRRLYDPEYVMDELAEAWRDDLRRYDRAFRAIEKKQAKQRLYARQITQEQETLAAFLDKHAIVGADEAEARRAIRIAMHINRDGLRDALCGENGESLNDVAVRSASAIMAQVIAEKATFTRRLLAVRVHHELARNELEDYECYLNRIMH